jgi:hypothetical protein
MDSFFYNIEIHERLELFFEHELHELHEFFADW